MAWSISHQLMPQDLAHWNQRIESSGSVFLHAGFAENTRSIGFLPNYASWVTEEDPLAAQAVFFTKQVGPKAFGLQWAVFFGEPRYSDAFGGTEQVRLFGQLLAAIKSINPAYIGTIGSMCRFSPKISGIPEDARITPFGTYEILLSESEETLWSRIHSKHRNAVRSATKEGVVVGESEDWGRFYGLLKETLARTGEACPGSSYVCGVGQSLQKEGLAKLFVAAHNGEWQAAAFILGNTSRAYYWFGATASPSTTGSGNLLHWTIIQKLKSSGVSIYDLGGARPVVNPDSKLAGIQRFKERFGGTYVEVPQWRLACSPARAALLAGLKRMRG